MEVRHSRNTKHDHNALGGCRLVRITWMAILSDREMRRTANFHTKSGDESEVRAASESDDSQRMAAKRGRAFDSDCELIKRDSGHPRPTRVDDQVGNEMRDAPPKTRRWKRVDVWRKEREATSSGERSTSERQVDEKARK